jgi:hypothetical protein
VLVTGGPADARDRLDIGVFARVGPPGQPEPIAVGPDGRIYVGTNQLGHGDTDAPSKVFAYSDRGELVREYVIEGQPLDKSHGIQGVVADRDGLLYALDRSADPRVIVLDPATGEQRVYARFRDVPPCGAAPGSSGLTPANSDVSCAGGRCAVPVLPPIVSSRRPENAAVAVPSPFITTPSSPCMMAARWNGSISTSPTRCAASSRTISSGASALPVRGSRMADASRGVCLTPPLAIRA